MQQSDNNAEEDISSVVKDKTQSFSNTSEKNAAQMYDVYLSYDRLEDDDQLEKAMVKDLLFSSYKMKFSPDRPGTKRPTLLKRVSGFFGGKTREVKVPEAGGLLAE